MGQCKYCKGEFDYIPGIGVCISCKNTMSSSSSSSYDAEKSRKEAERERTEERAMDWRTYTDKFGNKVRVSGKTGDFQVKMFFWGWMGSSYKGNIEIRYPNGDLYVGGVHGSLYHGKGKITWKETGNSYEGDWVYHHKTGKGKYTWANGAYYEGDFVDGNFNGYGVRLYSDGCRYEGQFKDDKRHGKGKMTWPNGETYEGDWRENYRTGKGKYVWPNNGYHEGDFVEGKYHGYGKHLYTDDYLYVGEFRDNVRHGKGVLTAPDGTAVEYYYENDKIVCKAAEVTDEIIARIYGSVPKPTSAPKSAKMPTVPKTETKTAPTTVKKAPPAPKAEITAEADVDLWNRLIKSKSAQKQKEELLAAHPTVVIPEGTKRIPGYLFDKCLNLKEVRLNSDLNEIGMWDFRGCKNLGPVVVIPKGVKKIYSYAFENCSSLKKIVLPNNITIDRLAFVDSGISEVEFETDPPRGVTVGYGAFKHCDKHMTKEMKNKIKELNSNAFK